MADAGRRSQLASAKKKLKAFQQKASSPVNNENKKKKKTKEGDGDPQIQTRMSPDPIQSLLKGLVSDLHRSNGVSFPSLGTMKEILESEDETSPDDNSAGSRVPVAPFSDNPLSENDHDGVKKSSAEYGSPSSTDSLRQLSEQLNGMVSQNSSYVNGENIKPNNLPEVEKQQNQNLLNRLHQEKEGFDQTLAKEQGALREQLQVHIQTIGILVSEKSELQTSLSFTQQAARQKGAEAEDLAMRLQSTKKRVAELERTLSGISLHQKQAEKLNKELEKERDNLRLESLKNSKSGEELKQQNSELTEKLNALLSENTDMKQQAEELHKKLEMAELTVQMLSSQVGTPDSQQQFQMVMEERNYLQAQLTQVTGALEHLRAERDHYVNKLKEEEAVWQETTQKFTKEIQTLSQEKENALIRIEALDTRVAELLLASAADTPAMEPAGPAEPSEEFLGLQRECERLAQELQGLENKYRAQVQDNSHLSLLNHQQEERLQELEKVLERHSEEDKEKQQILENMQNDKTTISRALTQNKQLKEQIAELQMAFVKLTNEKAELTVLVDGYRHDHGKKLADLQESLGHVNEQLAAKEEEVRQLQAHRDEISAHLQQYSSAFQQLSAERQEIQKQYMLQLQLMDRLQHEEMQRKVSEDMRLKELEKSRENLELLTKENQELREQAFRIRTEPPKQELQRMEGDAVDGDAYEDKTSETSLVIPEDFESREEMVAFLNAAIAKLQGERDETARHLSELKNYCHDLLLQVSNLQQQQMTGASRDVTLENVPKEVYDALQSDMDKLAIRFTDLMQEKVELKDRVEELEHRCVQLSGETDTIGEYIALYQSQRAILKQRHQEKEDYVSRLAQEKEEMKAKLLELQVLVTRLVTERNEWHGKYVDATKTLMEFGEVELPANAETPGIGDADIQGFENVDLENPDKGPPETGSPSPSYQGANPVSGSEDPTAKQIMQLLHEIQNSQKQSSSLLQSTCIPFYYRIDEHGEIHLMVL
ncbi:golgin subfamily A member 2-like isoform X3 [Spea bombifrons]|uniref:golgin subfamily A member 2-like isoform X3 n=1 Tax=Spea bombifrons TaxID=233779 RepID=UPI00234BCB20|nr:golgin subfamily A member 2-like isoform X3 [Spea bombifrons]